MAYVRSPKCRSLNTVIENFLSAPKRSPGSLKVPSRLNCSSGRAPAFEMASHSRCFRFMMTVMVNNVQGGHKYKASSRREHVEVSEKKGNETSEL